MEVPKFRGAILTSDIDRLVEKLAEKVGKRKEEVRREIDRIRKQWGVSELGALLAFADRMGVKLMRTGEEKPGKVTLDEAISQELQSFDTEFIVVRVSDPTETRSGGRMVTLVVGDETRSAALVAFDEVVEKLEELDEGDLVLARNLTVGSFRNSPQLVVTRETELEVVGHEENPDRIIERNISEVKHGEYVRVRGVVASEPADTGERVYFWLSDETGSTRVNLWGEEADRAMDLDYGDGVIVEGWVSTRSDYPVINVLRTQGRVEPTEVSIKPAIRKRVEELDKGDIAEVSGVIVTVYARRRYYEACPTCGRAMKEGECPEHGAVEPERRPVLNVVVDDGSGTVRTVFFGEHAVEFVGYETTKEYLEADESDIEERLLGESVSVVLRVRGEGVVEDYDAVALRARILTEEDFKREIQILARELKGEEGEREEAE